ncbi:MAG TPA: polysaccharide biosynthesis C-terminal domain-containing protein [Chitinophagaceae bacterium]|nr:polysaccharide biosynthesis C-terminal domain-containing protein [Chitinophagaceae bacterium]
MEFQRILYQSIVWRGFYFATQLLLNILIARVYEPSGSGWLFYTLNNYAFVILVLSLSIDSGMGYYLAAGKIKPSKLSALGLTWTLLASFLSFLWLYYYASPPQESKRFFLAVSVGYIAGSMMISFFSALFHARKNFMTPNLVLVSINSIMIGLLGVLYYGNQQFISSQDFILIYIFSFFIQGLLLAVFFQVHASEKMAFPSSPELKWLLGYSLLAFTGNLLTFLVFRVDYWLIQYFGRNSEELGNYIQVSKLAQLFFTLPSVLATAVFPLTAGGLPSIGTDLKILSRIVFIAALSGCLVLALTGYWLFPAVFGEKFDDMYLPFLLLAPGIIAICLAYPLAGYFSGRNRISVNIFSSLLALILIVAGNIIFIPLYGIRGAAAVSSIGYISLCGFLLFNFKKYETAGARDLVVPRKADLAWLRQFMKKRAN